MDAIIFSYIYMMKYLERGLKTQLIYQTKSIDNHKY